MIPRTVTHAALLFEVSTTLSLPGVRGSPTNTARGIGVQRLIRSPSLSQKVLPIETMVQAVPEQVAVLDFG
jgi:hypothetical protein